MKRQYVTAFPGRRDSYQLPLALLEHDRLACFVTDGYDSGWVARTLRWCGYRGLSRRICPELPANRVRPGFDLEIGARMLSRLTEPSRSAVMADDWLARRGAAMANARRASALFYEFQAEQGFGSLRSREQRRILFHFHPHPQWEHPLLLREAADYPEFAAQIKSGTRTSMAPRYAGHTRQAWRVADHVLVASTCTRDSLLGAGCPPEKITVVPYGREAIEAGPVHGWQGEQRMPFLLWVGAGSVRKGLHHLCRAWEQAGAARLGELVVVARVVDPGMEKFLDRPGIRWVKGLPRAGLNWHYRTARAFVLPSISEGFGQVYLEALAHGCRVIGTRNSVLPDVTAAQPWIDYVEPGDLGMLATAVQRALQRPVITPSDRAAVVASVADFTWVNFRNGVEQVLCRFD